ncbi:MAG: hydroxymyristoyl-ACP dehydratase [Alistipes sp.]|nr:hydroxymyristoyl-ACP dehydratase [Candidatus Minthomonas equi]
MIFQNNLYFIDSSTLEDGVWAYGIHLNPEHVIYSVHFPGEPITPGACILQMAIELLSLSSDRKLEPSIVDNVKFLSPLTPDIQGITVRIKSETMDAGAVKSGIQIDVPGKCIAKLSIICQTVLPD